MKAKKFDSVKMMRDSLSKRYFADPSAEEKDLKRIRAKYNMSAK